jgi:LysR family transcriptional regulator, low CO2-responsive transcriptional regulator
MNITQLRLFRDIARELSFVKVARQNHITQPAVSVHIQKLEDELGKKLFTRTPHNTRLTSDGEMILGDVKEILRLCEGLKIRSSYSQGILEGNIRIAAIHSVGMYEIGDFLSSFMRAFPRVHIHLEYRRADEIYSLLGKEAIDVGMVAYPEKRTNIQATPCGEDTLVFIAHPGHALASRKSISLKHLADQPFIAFESGIPTREAIDGVLAEHNIGVDYRMFNDNIFTLKKAVEAGIGVSIVPANTVDEEIQKGSLIRLPIRDIKLTRPIALLQRKKHKPNKPLEIFIQHLLEFHGQKTH